MGTAVRGHAKNLLARLLQCVFLLIKPRESAFVYGNPRSEGNAISIVRALLENTNLEVWWSNPPDEALLRAIGVLENGRLRFLHNSKAPVTVWKYLRCKYIFTTTDLYGMPTPRRKRVIVNLWHGEGPKSGPLFPLRDLKGPSSSYLVGSSSVFADQQAANAGIARNNLLLVGLPRIDLLRTAPTENVYRFLDHFFDTEHEKFVVWMPTFRKAKSKKGKLAWVDSEAGLTSATENELSPESLVRTLLSEGVLVVVKPHPLDYENFQSMGIKTLNDRDLEAAGIPLYYLLGASDGLITDYSSVWVDYLYLNKPIGFYSPDEKSFWNGRTQQPGATKIELPGSRLTTLQTVTKFSEEVRFYPEGEEELRLSVFESLGLSTSESMALDLLRRLNLTS